MGGRHGTLMVSVLGSGWNGLGSIPAQGTALRSWARHFTQVYTHVDGYWQIYNFHGRVEIEIEIEILLAASCYRNWDKLWPTWLGSSLYL